MSRAAAVPAAVEIENSADALLRIDHAGRVFRMGEVEVVALADITLSIRTGEFLVILGPSGSGKSTLLNLIGGMDRPTSGHVWYGDRDLTRLSDEELTRYRRHEVGFVFQFYNLVPTLTAYENVQVATELVKNPLDAHEALRLVELEHRAEHFPAQLSGGEQQRVAIARALAKRPRLLLADEPTGALDLETARHVLRLLQDLNQRENLTTVLITHNSAIGAIAQRIARIVSGHLAEVHANERVLRAEEVEW
jgi:putative ABC transport system ATP-binding protein